MTPDEDHQFYRFTDTALLRVHAPPVFLAPWLWPKRAWQRLGCSVMETNLIAEIVARFAKCREGRPQPAYTWVVVYDIRGDGYRAIPWSNSRFKPKQCHSVTADQAKALNDLPGGVLPCGSCRDVFKTTADEEANMSAYIDACVAKRAGP